MGIKEETAAVEGKSEMQLLVATFKHMRHPYQLLIIPLTIWSGVEQGFFQSDYTAVSTNCEVSSSAAALAQGIVSHS